MNKRQFRTFDEAQVEFYKKHPEKLKGHISVALSEYQKDGDEKAFLAALSMATTVHGGFSKVAKSTGLNRAHLYKALSSATFLRIVINISKLFIWNELRLVLCSYWI